MAAFSSAASIPSTNSLTLNNINSPLANATAPNPIDQRFTTSFKVFGPPIDKNHCLMNAVKAMTILALLDSDQKVGPSKFVSATWPNVVIATEGPTEEGQVEARFLLWGLFLGIKSIMIRSSVYSHWYSMIITLRWKSQVVGYITLSKPPAQLVLPGRNQTIGLGQGSNTNLTTVATDVAGKDTYSLSVTNILDALINASKLTNTPGSSDISVDITGTGKTMTLDNVFMTIMNGLVYIAPFSTDQIMEPFETSPRSPYDSTLQMTYYGLDPAKAGFTYHWAAESLSELAETYMGAKKYPEVHFNALLLGVPVGHGSIIKGRT
ncbi:hypothetical protein OEA41_002493 [Lepraria neglecta]|uniref:Uncharacterized protein n=1 Tax=Lepraria neglecta TaxID=209136 RepID=A0AAE0DMF4_9LECA|nr:hypothetical protein OEA41_002493 [Lepraria neglecta]